MDFAYEETNSLLIAPTGWGKTSLILKLLTKKTVPYIYYSPLRALADEFYQRVKGDGFRSFAPKSRSEFREAMNLGSFDILVCTYEVIDDLYWGELLHGDYLHIIDEVHLNYLWGNSFRPLLKNILFELSHFDARVLMLTATSSMELETYLKSIFKSFYRLSHGNFRLKKDPTNYIILRDYYSYLDILDQTSKACGVILVFCKYKKQVRRLTKLYQSKGLRVLSCVSGEVKTFRSLLDLNHGVDMIFCTSVLSHGVNLPKISKILILYPVKSVELWIQMIGRGGRQGEEFDVIQMNYRKFGHTNLFKAILKGLWLKLRLRGIRLCNLKD